MRERLLKDEAGFTLTELMVTIMIMITVLFALYSIFDMSIRVFSFGNDKVEATENARLGLEKMEREIRAAYPYDKAAGTPEGLSLFKPGEWTTTKITFGNDLDGNRKIECPTPETPARCETITYDVYQPSGSTTYALGRINTSGGSRQPVVEFVDYVDVSNTGLNFRYFQSDGTTEVSPGGDESQIALVSIELRVKVNGRTQTLTTDAALRNRRS